MFTEQLWGLESRPRGRTLAVVELSEAEVSLASLSIEHCYVGAAKQFMINSVHVKDSKVRLNPLSAKEKSGYWAG